MVQKDLAPRLRELADGRDVTPKLMVAAAAEGDVLVAAAIERAARYLGIGIANAITITAVELVVITGGMSALGELLLQPVRDVIRERVRCFRRRSACGVLDARRSGRRNGWHRARRAGRVGRKLNNPRNAPPAASDNSKLNDEDEG